jgi:putative holliday junction resolvase
MSDSSKGPAGRTPNGDRADSIADAGESDIPVRGRLLGLDFGTVRVGLAVSDEEQRLALPLETYTRRDRQRDAQHLIAVLGDYHIVGLIVGLPLHMGGEEGQKAGEARRFGAWARSVTALPTAFWDERLSTSLADEHLMAARLSPKKRKLLRDKIAAQIMLQSYLDSRGVPAR